MDATLLGTMLLMAVILASLVSSPASGSQVIIVPSGASHSGGTGLLAALVLVGILLIALTGQAPV